MADPLLRLSMPVQTITPRPATHHTLASSVSWQPLPKPSEAVLIIPRFEAEAPGLPEKFVIIKDAEKSTLGFPFGGVENGSNGLFDRDKTQAARREILEEIFGRESFSEKEAARLGLVINEQNFIGTIRKAVNHVVHVCSFVLPASARSLLRPGIEQQVVLIIPGWKIDKFIAEDIFLDTHAKGWEMFKQQFHK
ncbi:MAG: hypothetical protein Q7S54_01430 [bacterium]|nr:hypothetical protein [bacterium]